MKKNIFLLVASFLFAITSQAQSLNAKITTITKVRCMQDSNGVAAVDAFGGTLPYTYLWMPSSQTTDTAMGLHATYTYTVTITDASNDTTIITIHIPTISTLGAVTTYTNVSCFGVMDGSATVFPSSGVPPYHILWTPPLDTIATITGLPAGTYTSTVTDANGCKVSSPVGVSQPAPLLLSASTIARLAAAYAAGGTAPYTFSWSPGGETTDTVSNLAPGTYTVTVTDAHICSNMAIVTIPDVYMALTMPTDGGTFSCGNPSYMYFPIMAAADSTLRFNSCVVDIDMGSEFLGDSGTNGGVTVTRGSHFMPAAGNDYNILNITNLSDTVTEIQFGDAADTSPNGTILPLITSFTLDTLFTVRLRIQNSCHLSTVNFTNTTTTESESYYTDKDTVSQIDTISATPVYTTCCPYACTYCCQYDINDSCIQTCPTTCYDTSWTISYVIDTIPPSSARTIAYTTTGYGWGSYGNELCQAYIQTWTDPINAGTNAKSVPPNSSILTMTGWGLGSKKGRVIVSDANSNSTLSITLDSVDILYWSENLIKVKIPSLMFNNTGRTPGTGPFEVFTSCGSPAATPHANPKIQINYNISSNASVGTKKLRPDIVMVDGTESIKFRCDTSITNDTPAFLCVKKAIAEWNCYTGVHWKLGPTIILDTTKNDSISVIYFSNWNFPTAYTLMYTKPWYFLTCYHSGDSVAFYDEADIQIKRDKYLPYGNHWSYDTTTNILSSNVYSFYDVITHELGHAHGLGHINDSTSVMEWLIHSGGYPRLGITTGSTYPGPASLLGGLDMVNTSVSYSPSYCPYSILIRDTITCKDPTLSVPGIPENAYNLNLYPNPINRGDITIAYQLNQNSYIHFKIIDCIGREIISLNDEHKPPGVYTEQINIDALARGVYLFLSNINGECQTIKFIKI